ncbi:MAG: GvpL/GvpF family gas vesicle protein [Ignavibacteriales bacterium]|nr:GvpL/GvpF family gas vesicle protein [Ignavibacteriales bacterium]
MKQDPAKKSSDLILEQLAVKIKQNETLRRKLEPFLNLPPDKVAAAVVQQFEFLFSDELRDLILQLVEQEINRDDADVTEIVHEKIPILDATESPEETQRIVEKPDLILDQSISTESIMERYGTKEHFPIEPLGMELKESEWFYLLGFCYAPDSTGHGIPSKKISLKGIDGVNNIILLDYGDVRFFIHQLQEMKYGRDNIGKLTVSPKIAYLLKYEHEKTLNILRSEEVIVPFPFWTIMQGKDTINNRIEDKYVDILRSLIEVHDAVEWDVEVFAYDQHIIELPVVADAAKDRIVTRESRHPVSKGRDVKVLDKLLFKEKSLAQEIHSQLLLHAAKSKIDFMIRLDNAFMDDWKSILSVRYNVGKDKRKNFYRSIRSIQQEYEQFKLMIRVTSPNVRISF